MRRGSKLGKYRIERKLGEGGFAVVYSAFDTIEGVKVALKLPHRHLLVREGLENFRKEARVNAQLDHPNILPIKFAGFIDDQFVIAYPLGRETLGERLTRRVSTEKALDWFEDTLEGVAFAHRRRIAHLDVKPDNLILFPDGRLRLADFGLARVSKRTMTASGSGTVGYLAPEQALGRPSLRSDVFSLGLILYRMLSGVTPQWPFDWPLPRFERVRAKVRAGMVVVIRKALETDYRKRHRDAVELLSAFRRARTDGAKRVRRRTKSPRGDGALLRWKDVRFGEFQGKFRASLGTRFRCKRCGGPVSEPMRACPWCGTSRVIHHDETGFPARCPRCRRGRKLDWRFCPWCYGSAFREVSSRNYSDARYEATCPACRSRLLMPFMKYCPACNRKVKRRWKPEGLSGRCPGCGWGVAAGFWEFCPWCLRRLAGK